MEGRGGRVGGKGMCIGIEGWMKLMKINKCKVSHAGISLITGIWV